MIFINYTLIEQLLVSFVWAQWNCCQYNTVMYIRNITNACAGGLLVVLLVQMMRKHYVVYIVVYMYKPYQTTPQNLRTSFHPYHSLPSIFKYANIVGPYHRNPAVKNSLSKHKWQSLLQRPLFFYCVTYFRHKATSVLHKSWLKISQVIVSVCDIIMSRDPLCTAWLSPPSTHVNISFFNIWWGFERPQI